METDLDPAPQPAPDRPLTRELTPAQWRLESAIAVVVVSVPALGAVAAAVWTVAVRPPTALDLAMFGIGYVATMLGITLALHRYFSHRAFEAHPVVHALLAVLGCTAFQGPIIRWVADHRRHHQFTDQPLDPHSPRLPADASLTATVRGLWRAHVGWFFDRDKTVARTYVPDLLADPVVRAIDRHYFTVGLASLVLPGVVGLAVEGTVTALISGVLFGGLSRVWATQNAIWGINSLTHAFGRRSYATRDTSHDIGWMSLFTLGEGWHNAHHAFPASPRVGLEPGQLDPTWWVIALLQWLGLARARPFPTPEQRERKRATLSRSTP